MLPPLLLSPLKFYIVFLSTFAVSGFVELHDWLILKYTLGAIVIVVIYGWPIHAYRFTSQILKMDPATADIAAKRSRNLMRGLFVIAICVALSAVFNGGEDDVVETIDSFEALARRVGGIAFGCTFFYFIGVAAKTLCEAEKLAGLKARSPFGTAFQYFYFFIAQPFLYRRLKALAEKQ
jgi:hypothetical protein